MMLIVLLCISRLSRVKTFFKTQKYQKVFFVVSVATVPVGIILNLRRY